MKVIFRWVQNRHHEPVFLSVQNRYRESMFKFSSLLKCFTLSLLKKKTPCIYLTTLVAKRGNKSLILVSVAASGSIGLSLASGSIVLPLASGTSCRVPFLHIF